MRFRGGVRQNPFSRSMLLFSLLMDKYWQRNGKGGREVERFWEGETEFFFF